MRWLWFANGIVNNMYISPLILERNINEDKFLFSVIQKHYENERRCVNCNQCFCNAEDKQETLERMRVCVNYNHKHWEAMYDETSIREQTS